MKYPKERHPRENSCISDSKMGSPAALLGKNVYTHGQSRHNSLQQIQFTALCGFLAIKRFKIPKSRHGRHGLGSLTQMAAGCQTWDDYPRLHDDSSQDSDASASEVDHLLSSHPRNVEPDHAVAVYALEVAEICEEGGATPEQRWVGSLDGYAAPSVEKSDKYGREPESCCGMLMEAMRGTLVLSVCGGLIAVVVLTHGRGLSLTHTYTHFDSPALSRACARSLSLFLSKVPSSMSF